MPDDIRALAREILHDPVTVQIGHAAPAETVSHALYPVAPHLKTALLLELLAAHRHRVRAGLHAHQAPRHAARQAAGAGRLPAQRRCRATCRRTSARRRSTASAPARYQILVATDIAARGIDVARHLARHQLRHARHDRRLHPPHRPHRPRRAHRRRLHAGDAGGRGDRGATSSGCWVTGWSRNTLPGFRYDAPLPPQRPECAGSHGPRRAAGAARTAGGSAGRTPRAHSARAAIPNQPPGPRRLRPSRTRAVWDSGSQRCSLIAIRATR